MNGENEFFFGASRYVARRCGDCEKCVFFHMNLRAGDVRCTKPRGAPPCAESERADGREVIFVRKGVRKTEPKTRPCQKRGQVAVKSQRRGNKPDSVQNRARRHADVK